MSTNKNKQEKVIHTKFHQLHYQKQMLNKKETTVCAY